VAAFREQAQEIGIRYSSSKYSVFGILHLMRVMKRPAAGNTDKHAAP
jgi:hypothetical protein